MTTFKVTNKGTISHDFKIAGKKTPSLEDRQGRHAEGDVQEAGKYAYLCTLPGHAAGGMKGTLTVK